MMWMNPFCEQGRWKERDMMTEQEMRRLTEGWEQKAGWSEEKEEFLSNKDRAKTDQMLGIYCYTYVFWIPFTK